MRLNLAERNTCPLFLCVCCHSKKSYPSLSSSGVIQKRGWQRFVLRVRNWRRCHRVSRRRARTSSCDGRGADQRSAPIEELTLLRPESQDARLQVEAVAPALLQSILPPLVGPVVGDDLGERDTKGLGSRFWGKRRKFSCQQWWTHKNNRENKDEVERRKQTYCPEYPNRRYGWKIGK